MALIVCMQYTLITLSVVAQVFYGESNALLAHGSVEKYA